MANFATNASNGANFWVRCASGNVLYKKTIAIRGAGAGFPHSVCKPNTPPNPFIFPVIFVVKIDSV